MTSPLRKLACVLVAGAFLLSDPVFAFRIKIKIKVKIAGRTIGTSVGANVPVGGGGVTLPLVPPDPGAVTSHLVSESQKELGKMNGNIVREAGIGYANLERETKRGASNVETNLRKAGADTERSVRKAGGDVGRELKAAQRDVEGAATAVYRFAVREAEGSIDSVRDADRRFREGKVIDAIWHLGLAPAQGTSDHAAQMATENEILGTIMQAAASVYGGPSGAAAYAAWLTYYQTGGDANAALRVGLTAAVKTYATQFSAAPATAGVTESFKQAAVGGAMNGLAVAAAGGSPADVQKAMLATAASMLVQDGYQALSRNGTVAEFAKTAKQVYCIRGLAERAQDNSCPSMNDYVKDAAGNFAMLDTKGLVQYVDIVKEVPGSDWLFLSREEALNKAAGAVGLDLDKLPGEKDVAKYKAGMKEINKIKDSNIVSILDDRWAVSYQAGRAVADLQAAVAPEVVLAYTGVSPAEVAKGGEDAKRALESVNKGPQEVITCSLGKLADRIWVARGKPGDELKCAVGEQGNDQEGATYYSKVPGQFCQEKMLEMASARIAQGWTCAGR